MKLRILIVALFAVVLAGCGDKQKVKQTKEDVQLAGDSAEIWIRTAQKTGVSATIQASYSGRSGGEVTGPGFYLDTGIRLSATFNVNPAAAIDRDTVQPLKHEAAQPGDEPDALTEVK